jgi:lipopolysaccharide assembly outer membrane protein LptD (OstA)
LYCKIHSKKLHAKLFLSRQLKNLDTLGMNIKLLPNRQWQLLFGTNLNLNTNKNLFTFGGITYKSCCWDIRIVCGTIVNKLDSSFKLKFDFNLKGFGAK